MPVLAAAHCELLQILADPRDWIDCQAHAVGSELHPTLVYDLQTPFRLDGCGHAQQPEMPSQRIGIT